MGEALSPETHPHPTLPLKGRACNTADGLESAARPAKDAGQGQPQSKYQRQDGDREVQRSSIHI